MKKEMLLITIIFLTLTLVLAQDLNQTQEPKELYTENAYGIFYLIIIAILLAITILTITIILPRIKEYT